MKQLPFIIIVLVFYSAFSQQTELPPDFRQHTLTDYNSSLLNPVFSLDRNNPESVALWTRWQWQGIDGDPTSIFLNYSRKINPESAAGAAFFQHNTGIYVQTGGLFNYAFGLDLENDAQIAFGLNLLAFQRKLADDDLLMDPMFPELTDSKDFIMRLAPGLQFKFSRFGIGLAAENLFDYNFSQSEKVSGPREKIYIGHASYEFPVTVFDASDSYVRPIIYLKSVPGYDNQFGLNALFSTPKFWAQGGYNDFYGFSAGVGGRFLNKLSIGALMEFGTNSDLDGFDPTIEIAAAFFIGPQFEEKQPFPEEEEVPEEIEEDVTEAEAKAEAEAEEQARLEEEARVAEEARLEEEARLAEEAQAKEEAEARAREEQARLEEEAKAKAEAEARAREAAIAAEVELERIREEGRKAEEEARKRREEFVKDSLEAVQLAEAEAARKQKELEEIAQQEESQPQEGEKYQEGLSEDGLQPGYYLVANVFGTKRYYERFMQTLTESGLEPKSFYRNVNKYNYVYLERYDTMQQARQARDSKFNGRYEGDTWIFRVVSQ